MPLIRDDQLVEDHFRAVADDEALPAEGAVVVSLARWQKDRASLLERKAPVGVRLKSDESPEAIADDLGRLALVALEFPKFRDGRAYSYARILRERHGYRGEIRAVGDVLMEQLHFMLRTGFNAFEIEGDDPLGQYRTAKSEFSVWYQPTGDGRPTAASLRHRQAADRPRR
jgi:uncharacterized protein (DUF934 family)